MKAGQAYEQEQLLAAPVNRNPCVGVPPEYATIRRYTKVPGLIAYTRRIQIVKGFFCKKLKKSDRGLKIVRTGADIYAI